MTHIRSALILIMLAALMFAAASMLVSTRDFWIGTGIVAACVAGYAAIGWIEHRR